MSNSLVGTLQLKSLKTTTRGVGITGFIVILATLNQFELGNRGNVSCTLVLNISAREQEAKCNRTLDKKQFILTCLENKKKLFFDSYTRN